MEITNYINKVKESNKNYYLKIENVKLKKIINKLENENEKIYKAKNLIEDYKKVLERKNNEISSLKSEINYLSECLNRIPKVFRRIFIKSKDNLLSLPKKENTNV